jgi:hypothetical protein
MGTSNVARQKYTKEEKDFFIESRKIQISKNANVFSFSSLTFININASGDLFTVLRICITLIRIRIFSYHFDPDPTFHFDPDPDPDPTFHFDPDPDPTFHFDPDPDPTFHFDAVWIRFLAFK